MYDFASKIALRTRDCKNNLACGCLKGQSHVLSDRIRPWVLSLAPEQVVADTIPGRQQ
jgi:hypothetical protein